MASLDVALCCVYSPQVKPAARVLEPGATCQLAVTMAALSPKKLPESVAECKVGGRGVPEGGGSWLVPGSRGRPRDTSAGAWHAAVGCRRLPPPPSGHWRCARA